MNAETLASLTTAGGTLVLAVATFSSTRSANRASRTAERALLVGLRPVLMHARLEDPRQKVGFADQHWLHFEGAGAAIEVTDDVIYLAAAVRNVGTGIAVLQGWYAQERQTGAGSMPALDTFTMLTRDIYIAPGDLGFWQGAIREPASDLYATIADAAKGRRPLSVDVLYSDLHGSQQTVSRFGIVPVGDDRWLAAVAQHWQVPEVQTSRWHRRRRPEADES